MAGAVSFLEKRVERGALISVIDIGSGSSCLLYACKKKGILLHGVGIEISKSRHDFAEQWRCDEGYSSIENLNLNITDVPVSTMNGDMCTILDSTFTYFHSVDPSMPEQILQQIFQGLNCGGWLILEMSTFLDARRSCQDSQGYYKWVELPKSNKYSYALYKVDYSKNRNIICSESRYLYRSQSGESKKIEYSKVYSTSELKKMVCGVGFTNVVFYSDYQETSFDEKKSNRLVLACQKRK